MKWARLGTKLRGVINWVVGVVRVDIHLLKAVVWLSLATRQFIILLLQVPSLDLEFTVFFFFGTG